MEKNMEHGEMKNMQEWKWNKERTWKNGMNEGAGNDMEHGGA
jgi:hypothetical protein